MVDRLFQTAYFCAYRLMKSYWWLRRPTTHGALVAIWHAGRILLVRTSYHGYYSLPGGYVRPWETARRAAIRELQEEIGLQVPEDRLQAAIDITHRWEHRHDHVEIFSLDVESPPRITVDNREVVAADFFEPSDALRLELFPPLRQHIESRQIQAEGQRASA